MFLAVWSLAIYWNIAKSMWGRSRTRCTERQKKSSQWYQFRWFMGYSWCLVWRCLRKFVKKMYHGSDRRINRHQMKTKLYGLAGRLPDSRPRMCAFSKKKLHNVLAWNRGQKNISKNIHKHITHWPYLCSFSFLWDQKLRIWQTASKTSHKQQLPTLARWTRRSAFNLNVIPAYPCQLWLLQRQIRWFENMLPLMELYERARGKQTCKQKNGCPTEIKMYKKGRRMFPGNGVQVTGKCLHDGTGLDARLICRSPAGCLDENFKSALTCALVCDPSWCRCYWWPAFASTSCS